MAAVLDFTRFSFTAEQVRDVNELIFEEFLKAPEINTLCTLYPNIVFDKQIGFVGEGGLVGVAGQGCNPTPQAFSIGTRAVTWQPKSWEILVNQCWTDLEGTAATYALKNGADRADFSDSDYYAIVVSVLSESVRKFVFRFCWFNDLSAESVTDGGIITDGVELKYFNIADGLWKQLMTQITANPSQRVTVTENAGASYAAQELSPDNAAKYLQKLKYKAPVTLRSRENAFVALTQSFYDAWEMYLQGKNLESTYVNLTDGRKVLKAYGMTLVPVPLWDEMIGRYENTGAKLNNPHRALYVQKETLAVGVDGEDSFEKMNIWYNRDSREVKTELMGKADAKLLNPAQFQLAI
jgi:hypothetical protein